MTVDPISAFNVNPRLVCSLDDIIADDAAACFVIVVATTG